MHDTLPAAVIIACIVSAVAGTGHTWSVHVVLSAEHAASHDTPSAPSAQKWGGGILGVGELVCVIELVIELVIVRVMELVIVCVSSSTTARCAKTGAAPGCHRGGTPAMAATTAGRTTLASMAWC